MKLDVLYSAARHRWPDLRDRVLAAEAEGFDTAWVYDHLSGESLGGDRMLECFSLAGALAGCTTRIGIGTLVANAANRTPALTVCAAASVQEISGGRFVLGLGAGAAPNTRWSHEHDVLGIEVAPTRSARHQRVEEVLDLCDVLWDPQRPMQYRGFPLPSPRPAILLGVNSVELAQLAARRCEAINVFLEHPRIAEFFDAARRARSEGDRVGSPLALTAWARWSPEAADPDGHVQHHLAALGGERLILVS